MALSVFSLLHLCVHLPLIMVFAKDAAVELKTGLFQLHSALVALHAVEVELAMVVDHLEPVLVLDPERAAGAEGQSRPGARARGR